MILTDVVRFISLCFLLNYKRALYQRSCVSNHSNTPLWNRGHPSPKRNNPFGMVLGECFLRAVLGGSPWTSWVGAPQKQGFPCGLQSGVQQGTSSLLRTTKQTVYSHEHASIRLPFPPQQKGRPQSQIPPRRQAIGKVTGFADFLYNFPPSADHLGSSEPLVQQTHRALILY